MIFGRSPGVNKAVSLGCYVIGVLIMTTNMVYTQRYFNQALQAKGDLQFYTTWGISTGIGLYEAFLLGVGTTPVAWGHLFAVPKKIADIQEPQQRKLAQYGAGGLAAALIIFGLIVYWVDYTTTIGGLGLGDILPARFLAWSLVIGSEIMFLAGNTLAWLALIGAATSKETKEKYQLILDKNSKGSASSLK